MSEFMRNLAQPYDNFVKRLNSSVPRPTGVAESCDSEPRESLLKQSQMEGLLYRVIDLCFLHENRIKIQRIPIVVAQCVGLSAPSRNPY